MRKLKPGLAKLDIDVQGEASIEPIGELAKLETLKLRGFAMNLAPLAKLARLRHLELHVDRSVKGLDQLANLVELRTLVIEESGLPDLQICAGMTKLVELRVVGGPKSAAGIDGARGLERVSLDRTQITNVAPLAKLTTLHELSLRFSRKVVDLGGLAKLARLRELDLFEMRGPLDLKPLAKLARLESLNLALTKVRDFSPLFGLRSLKALEADATVAQLAALKQHLPKAALEVDVDDDDCIEVGPVQVFEGGGGAPWTISQDLVDDFELDDQNDVEELVAAAFKKAQPKLYRKVTFDSEGDAFVATSEDRAAIMALAKLIERLIDDDGNDDDA